MTVPPHPQAILASFARLLITASLIFEGNPATTSTVFPDRCALSLLRISRPDIFASGSSKDVNLFSDREPTTCNSANGVWQSRVCSGKMGTFCFTDFIGVWNFEPNDGFPCLGEQHLLNAGHLALVAFNHPARLAALLRAVGSSNFFRSRRDFGVASTYSSGPIYSSARSKLILSGGSS